MKIFIGLDVKNRNSFDKQYIIAANHNSHLDALAIISLFPYKKIKKLKLVGASDYFFKNPFLSWLSTYFLGIIPLERRHLGKDSFENIYKALREGYTILFFPEGSRGNPEEFGEVKKGILKISKKFSDIEVLPIKLSRTGIVLPKGSFLPVPLIVTINIKNSIIYTNDEQLKTDLVNALTTD